MQEKKKCYSVQFHFSSVQSFSYFSQLLILGLSLIVLFVCPLVYEDEFSG